MIEFTLLGKPKALKRHRSTRSGIMYDPSSKDKTDIWFKIYQFKPKRPIAGDIYLRVIFYMPRPKYHYRSGKFKHLLKSGVPINHSVKPDIDNLVKMIADIIQGKDRFILDDSQICKLEAYKEYSEIQRTKIIIQEI